MSVVEPSKKSPTPGTPAPPDPKPEPLAEVTNFQLLKRMFRFLGPVKRLAFMAGAVIIVAMVLELLTVNTYRTILNTLSEDLKDVTAIQRIAAGGFLASLGQEPMRTIVYLVEILGLLVAVTAVTRFFRERLQMQLTMDMVYDMRAAVYDCLQNVGFAFHDEHSSGALINRALSDLSNVRSFLNMSLLQTIEIVVYVVGFNLYLLNINKWAALAALIPVPLWILYIRWFSKRIQPAQRAQMKASDEVVTVFTENIAGVQVIKAFATEQTEIKKYGGAVDSFFDRMMATVNLWRNFVPVIRGIASASHLALFTMGALLVVWGQTEVGDLIAFSAAMWGILSRLQQINTISDQYQRAIVSARRFFEVLDAPPSVAEAPDAPALPKGPGAVEFNFASFGYTPEKPVVEDIAFDVPGGSIVAIVGPTGAGKTTLMQLLSRFYDPQKGQIYIDGVDLRKVSLESIRHAVGFVFQETFLFSDTVANNIRYGYPRASMGQVEAAARIAQAHEFIMDLPEGYDTMLGERGATLSGGQRQRLAIARAIISNPRILVLDDALAAVDPETEHLISRALELVMVDRTVFIIAHRLSTVKASDLVIVLEHGRITQAGTHKELLRQEGHYRHIAQVQLAYQEKEMTQKMQKQHDILQASHTGMPAQK